MKKSLILLAGSILLASVVYAAPGDPRSGGGPGNGRPGGQPGQPGQQPPVVQPVQQPVQQPTPQPVEPVIDHQAIHQNPPPIIINGEGRRPELGDGRRPGMGDGRPEMGGGPYDPRREGGGFDPRRDPRDPRFGGGGIYDPRRDPRDPRFGGGGMPGPMDPRHGEWRPGMGPRPGFDRPRFDWNYGPGQFGGHRIIDFNGKQYIDTPDYCGISSVTALVTGDSVVINSLEIIYGDGGAPQSLTYGAQRVQANTYTPAMDLDGYTRCVNGFYLDAWSDMDMSRAQITLYGYDMNGQWIPLSAPISISEYNTWRGFRRPGMPPPPPLYPPAPAPTVRWTPTEYGPVVGRKFFGLRDTLQLDAPYGLNNVTEIAIRPSGNDIRIDSVTVIDDRGMRIPVQGFTGLNISNEQPVARRISDYPVWVRSIEITGTTPFIGSSEVRVYVRAGLAR